MRACKKNEVGKKKKETKLERKLGFSTVRIKQHSLKAKLDIIPQKKIIKMMRWEKRRNASG